MSKVVSTLRQMAEIYAKSTIGGGNSDRFPAYVELNRSGVPASQYNPMTSRSETIDTIEHLIGLDAEAVVARSTERPQYPPLGRHL